MENHLLHLSEQRRVIITGGNRGIGLEISRQFVNLGCDVLIICRNSISENAEDTMFNNLLSVQNVKAIFTDLSNSTSLKEFTQILSEDKYNVLINNAGQYECKSSANIDMQKQLFDLNYWAPVSLISAFSSALNGSPGNVINISSINSSVSLPTAIAYCSSKAALEMATRCLAKKLGPSGIRVNAIAPGPIPTALLTNALEGQSADFMLESIPLGRLGRPEDVANAVRWLSSDEAKWITGHVLTIDGGLSC